MSYVALELNTKVWDGYYSLQASACNSSNFLNTQYEGSAWVVVEVDANPSLVFDNQIAYNRPAADLLLDELGRKFNEESLKPKKEFTIADYMMSLDDFKDTSKPIIDDFPDFIRTDSIVLVETEELVNFIPNVCQKCSLKYIVISAIKGSKLVASSLRSAGVDIVVIDTIGLDITPKQLTELIRPFRATGQAVVITTDNAENFEDCSYIDDVYSVYILDDATGVSFYRTSDAHLFKV